MRLALPLIPLVPPVSLVSPVPLVPQSPVRLALPLVPQSPPPAFPNLSALPALLLPPLSKKNVNIFLPISFIFPTFAEIFSVRL